MTKAFNQEEYNRACEQAAEDQGLNPIRRALEQAGVPNELEQTGGFCMAIKVPVGDQHILLVAEEANTCSAWLYRDQDCEGEPVFEAATINQAAVRIKAIVGEVK